MIVILIAAGRSRRFWPLSEKSFFPICGTTLLQEQVRRLQAAGAKEILLVAGAHNLTQTKAAFPSFKVVKQKDLDLGMRGALLCALPACGRKPVLIVGANDVIEAGAYRELFRRAKTLVSGGFILAQRVRSHFPGGYLSLRGKRILSIVEKPAPGAEPGTLVNIVAHVHASAPVLLGALRETRHTKDDGYEQTLDLLFRRERYEAVLYTGMWQAIKYPWHLLSLLPFLLPSGEKPLIHKTASVHRTAVIEGPVVLSRGVKVLAHATIMGPCFVGPECVIANNALVRGSSVGPECVIGYNTEIVRSVLAGGVWTHSSYIGDSVIGEDVSFGGGTITGNLRLDEGEVASIVQGKEIPTGLQKFGTIIGNHCRTGIHTCIAPGMKIGGGSFISSSTLVSADIPDDSFVKEEGGKLTVRPNRVSPLPPESRGEFRRKLTNQKK